jgi:hypothetical protein
MTADEKICSEELCSKNLTHTEDKSSTQVLCKFFHFFSTVEYIEIACEYLNWRVIKQIGRKKNLMSIFLDSIMKSTIFWDVKLWSLLEIYLHSACPLLYSSTLQRKAVLSSEKSVNFNQIPQRNIPKDRNVPFPLTAVNQMPSSNVSAYVFWT